jgi:hypothetical protein
MAIGKTCWSTVRDIYDECRWSYDAHADILCRPAPCEIAALGVPIEKSKLNRRFQSFTSFLTHPLVSCRGWYVHVVSFHCFTLKIN